jgi:hypothetical protein
MDSFTQASRPQSDEAAAHSRRCDPFCPEYDQAEALAATQRAIIERRKRREMPALHDHSPD